MSDETSALLGLPYIQAAQAQKHVTHNEALRMLDVMVQAAVNSRDRTTPPSGPAEGERHIVAPGGQGDWAGQDNAIALYETGVWVFYTPQPGWKVHVLDDNQEATFDGSAWEVNSATEAAFFGINTIADPTNRLSVSSEAALFTHVGAGHQVKVNKNSAADTASLLFQTNWSGRAEMGTAGSDSFSIKVSADGATWVDALTFDPATGTAAGAAVQQSATDVTPGRLARAEYTYGPGTIVGSVNQAGGVPTGSVIESGINANGTYTRFADGTQICTRKALINVVAGGYQGFQFPAIFADTSNLVVSFAHADYQPNSALELPNILSFTGYGDIFQYWGLQLRSPASAASPIASRNSMFMTAIGRWF